MATSTLPAYGSQKWVRIRSYYMATTFLGISKRAETPQVAKKPLLCRGSPKHENSLQNPYCLRGPQSGKE